MSWSRIDNTPSNLAAEIVAAGGVSARSRRSTAAPATTAAKVAAIDATVYIIAIPTSPSLLRLTTSTANVENVVSEPQKPMPPASCSTRRARGRDHSSANTTPRMNDPATLTASTGQGNRPASTDVNTAHRNTAPMTPPAAIATAR